MGELQAAGLSTSQEDCRLEQLDDVQSITLPRPIITCPDQIRELSQSDKTRARPPRSRSMSPHRDPETRPAGSTGSRREVGETAELGKEAGESGGVSRLDADGIASTSQTAQNKAASHGPLPNKITSQSHPCTGAATESSTGRAVDADVNGMGKATVHPATREWPTLHLSSSSPSASASPIPSSNSSTKLNFLDKVISAPDAPRTVAISPYGSSHPLFLAAKKYRLQVNGQPATSSKSNSPDPVVSSSSSTASPASRAPAENKGAENQKEKQSETAPSPEEEEGEETFRAPSLSRPSSASHSDIASSTSTSEETMGSRPAYARSQMRVARRPSPLDLPASKRRRSNDGSLHVIKVEDCEEETTFLISGRETSRDAAADFEPESRTSTTLKRKATSSRPASPSSSSIATEHRRAASPASSVDLRSTVAEDDCSCFENELRTPKMRVPLRLPRPELVQELDLSALKLDPSLQGVPMPYILDNIALRGPVLLSSVVDSSIALPSTSKLASSPSSGPAIPTSVAVRTPTRLALDSALPEYALAVSSDDSQQVMFLPIHGLVLATSCKSFAGLARPPSVEAQSIEEGEDTIRILPVVHIHLPSSNAFSKLIPFFYTHEAGSLLSSLLPIQHLPPVSLSAAQQSPALLASHLAKIDPSILAQYVHFNHTLWKTAVALGAARDELWKVLQGAWNALVAALTIQQKQSLKVLKSDESDNKA